MTPSRPDNPATEPDSVSTADVAIIGAGPGGAATALHLARAGIKSVLLDKAAFPRDKVCGDALSGKVISELRRLGGDTDALPALLRAEARQVPSWGIAFIAPNGETLRVPFKPGFDKAADYAPGHLMRRFDFDDFLVRQVRAQPLIELRENTEVASWERAPDGYWVLFDKVKRPLVRARLLVAADGAQSRFGRIVGGHTLEPDHHCAGLRAYYRGVGGLDPDNFIELHFLPDFLPGYLWI
ncbi:MAG: FAD-dependent monooxygenase, partial [Hymenobacteraceae bacterium]|nr:FAD-dependent monooxygenase [Hymenobacteraceae bacterium]